MPIYANNVVNIPKNLGMYTRMTSPLRPSCELPSVASIGAGSRSSTTPVTPNSVSSSPVLSSPRLSDTSGSIPSSSSRSSRALSSASSSSEPWIMPVQPAEQALSSPSTWARADSNVYANWQYLQYVHQMRMYHMYLQSLNSGAAYWY
uniref:Uncharacterized protein n=1 Tax=Panagrellus redivivus TaxID=6233 RepID=A0A7E4ZY14_PANRE